MIQNGQYKFRVDYLGHSFWSQTYSVPATLEGSLALPHRDVAIQVDAGYDGVMTPIASARVYLFGTGGNYLGTFKLTDDAGRVVFNLPETPFKARVDWMGQQYWTEAFTWKDVAVHISYARMNLGVNADTGPVDGAKAYVFTVSGAYLGIQQTTDAQGTALFELPAGAYKFRADYLGSQYWSGEVDLVAGQVTAGQIDVSGGNL